MNIKSLQLGDSFYCREVNGWKVFSAKFQVKLIAWGEIKNYFNKNFLFQGWLRSVFDWKNGGSSIKSIAKAREFSGELSNNGRVQSKDWGCTTTGWAEGVKSNCKPWKKPGYV